MTLSLFAVCAPGLEPFAAQELHRLQLSDVGIRAGGVNFTATLAGLYRANLHVRTASRVLVRLGEFHASAFSELRKKASHCPWEHYLTPGQPVTLRVTCRKSRLYHSGAVAERIAGAIADRLGRPVTPQPAPGDEESGEAPPQIIVARLDHDHCTLSLDSSGALLHRRGYRLAGAKAPLRETLAAGLLMAAGWTGAAPLLDPFCGSGTIAIEAALMALHLAPGRARRFAFMDWPRYDAKTWRALLADSAPPGTAPVIQASDRDAGAIEAARANAERAGVDAGIEFSVRAVSAIEPPAGPGWVITNPPYGVRASPSGDLRNLYAQLGHVLRARCRGWTAAVLCSDEQLLRQIGAAWQRRFPLVNGGLRVTLACARI
jgi:putative N6-adenine-specific DNA methylase